MLSHSPVFEITHPSDASLADRILGLCILIKDVAHCNLYWRPSLLKMNLL